MMRMNKKGKIFSWLLMLTFITVIIIAFALLWDKNSEFRKNPIGEKQSALFIAYSSGEKATFFVREAAKLALPQALYDFAKEGGLSNGSCSYFGFMLFNESCRSSSIKGDYIPFYGKALDKFLLSYSLVRIPLNNYNFLIKDGSLKAAALSDILIDVSKPSIEGIGDPKDVKIKECGDGKCVADLAEGFVENYESLPYVWGGESPFSVEDTLDDQSTNPSSVFKSVGVERYQPAGSWRSGLPTVPGFDCSGFVWWTFKHAGVDLFNQRLTSTGYLELAKKTNAHLVCKSTDCNRGFINTEAKHGDVIFVKPCGKDNEGVCHIAIYVGNGEIAESVGSIDGDTRGGMVVRLIPGSYFEDVGIHSIYRFNIESESVDSVPVSYESVGEVESYGFSEGDVAKGVYSIDPSFKIDFGLSFDFFDKAYNDAALLGAACSSKEDQNVVDGSSLTDCIENNIEGFNFSLDCSSEDENVLFDFAEQLSNCYNTLDVNCACEFDLKEPVELSYTKDNNTLLKYKDLEQELPFKVLLGKDFVKAIPLKIDGKVFAERDELSITVTKESDMGACRINDRTFKICTASDKEYPITIKGEKQFAKIPLRFAYMVEDKSAPALVKFSIERVKGNAVVLSWDSSVSPDVRDFNVYYSATTISKPVDTFRTGVVEESKSFISLDDALSNKEILFVKDGKYYYAFSLPIKGKYFFSVAPVDFNDNTQQSLTAVSAEI